jgi:hypothetical protein
MIRKGGVAHRYASLLIPAGTTEAGSCSMPASLLHDTIFIYRSIPSRRTSM